MKRRRKKNNKGQSRVDLTKRLAGYSLTAGVVLASGGKVQAGLIYSGPMDEPFGTTYGPYDLTMEGSNPEARFGGASNYSTMYSATNARFDVTRLNNNFQVNTSGSMGNSVNNLPFSTRVGPNNNSSQFVNHGIFYSKNNSSYWTGRYGNWMQDGQSDYFAFKFDLENTTSDTVYGWGQVERIDASNGRLLGWAYEDSGAEIHIGDTGTAPVVPLPSALGLAAMGAAGVFSIRRRKKA